METQLNPTATTPQGNTGLAVHNTSHGGSDIATLDSVDMDCISGEAEVAALTPYIKLIHGTSKLAAQFNPGDLVLDPGKACPAERLAQKGETLNLLVLSAVCFYREWLDAALFGTGAIPRTWASKKDAVAEIGARNMEWRDAVDANGQPTGRRKGPDAGPAAKILVLIEKPKDLASAFFVLDVAGTKYAPALLAVDKGSYAPVLGVIENRRRLDAAANPGTSGRFSNVRYTLSGKVETRKDGKTGALLAFGVKTNAGQMSFLNDEEQAACRHISAAFRSKLTTDTDAEPTF